MIIVTPFNNSAVMPLDSGEFCALSSTMQDTLSLLELDAVVSSQHFILAKGRQENLRYLISEESNYER